MSIHLSFTFDSISIRNLLSSQFNFFLENEQFYSIQSNSHEKHSTSSSSKLFSTYTLSFLIIKLKLSLVCCCLDRKLTPTHGGMAVSHKNLVDSSFRGSQYYINLLKEKKSRYLFKTTLSHIREKKVQG